MFCRRRSSDASVAMVLAIWKFPRAPAVGLRNRPSSSSVKKTPRNFLRCLSSLAPSPSVSFLWPSPLDKILLPHFTPVQTLPGPFHSNYRRERNSSQRLLSPCDYILLGDFSFQYWCFWAEVISIAAFPMCVGRGNPSCFFSLPLQHPFRPSHDRVIRVVCPWNVPHGICVTFVLPLVFFFSPHSEFSASIPRSVQHQVPRS